jgi:putative hydroxymethylpyrimidine transport system substrate-binding protein
MRPLRLALEWFQNPDHVPFFLAQREGWLKEAGLALELIEPREHFDAARALASGEVDVAITEPIHLVQDRLQDIPIVGFTRFLHTNGGVMTLDGLGVERPRDMAGKRVQYPGAPGPGGLAIVRTMIEADGGPADAPLTPVNHSFYHTDALATGLADVATLVFYNFEVVEAQHRGLKPRLFALKDWGVPDFCQLILTAHERTLTDDEATLRALIRALRRGVDLIHQEPERARAVYSEATGSDPDDALTRAIFDATTRCFTHDFTMSADYYAGLSDWLQRTGQADRGVSPEQCWTNRLAL